MEFLRRDEGGEGTKRSRSQLAGSTRKVETLRGTLSRGQIAVLLRHVYQRKRKRERERERERERSRDCRYMAGLVLKQSHAAWMSAARHMYTRLSARANNAVSRGRQLANDESLATTPGGTNQDTVDTVITVDTVARHARCLLSILSHDVRNVSRRNASEVGFARPDPSSVGVSRRTILNDVRPFQSRAFRSLFERVHFRTDAKIEEFYSSMVIRANVHKHAVFQAKRSSMHPLHV